MTENYTRVGWVDNGPPAVDAANLIHMEAGIEAVDNAKLPRLAVQATKKTSNFAATAGKYYMVDTTSNAVTASLPTAPADGTVVGFRLSVLGGANYLTVTSTGGDTFDDPTGGTTRQLKLQGQILTVQYALGVWYAIAASLPLDVLDARYAGGGAGALLTANDLSEIEAAGSSHQLAARGHLGLGSASTLSSDSFDAAGAAAAALASSAPSSRGLADVLSSVAVDVTATLAKHNPIDTSTGARAVTLPEPADPGAMVSVEKFTTDTNIVTVSGHLRGDSGTTASVTLTLAHESVLFVRGSDATWWPVAGRLSLSTLDARYPSAGGFMAVVGTSAVPITSAATARPAGAPAVYWICAAGVTPTNATAGDLIFNHA